ncbi:MAG: hypothetical protein PHI12_11865 [Dehalococcoidales bacterium]|nr:hypothetical protein [Dehalococcoidales bacterium]
MITVMGKPAAFIGGTMVATEAQDMSPCRCHFCHELRKPAFIMMEDERQDGCYNIPKGFVCAECAETPEVVVELLIAERRTE